MKKYEFVDLGIDSTKYPFAPHLFWEHSTYGIIMVDSTDQTSLIISTDKGDNWSVIDLSDNTNSYKIQSGWLEGNDLWLVMCDNDGTADDFEVCFIELDDSNDCNPIAVSVGADANSVYAFDIWVLGGNTYVFNFEKRAGQRDYVVWDVDTAPFIQKDISLGETTIGLKYMFGIINNGTFYFLIDSIVGPNDGVVTGRYIHDPANLIMGATVGDLDNLYNPPDSVNDRWTSTDGINHYFLAKKLADNKLYLMKTILGDTAVIINAEHNIIIQLSRNNSATSPNELEKGFGTADEKVYEITPIKGGLTLFQDMGALLTTNIIGITDNYLIAADTGGGAYPMFELQDVSSSEISECIIEYNMGNVTQCNFTSTDNLATLSSVKFYDDNDVLTFFGNIIEKQYDDLTNYIYTAIGYDNETITYKVTYDATAGINAKTAIEAILDSANWLYYSSSITDPSILITADFQNLTFKEVMDYIADRCDYVWYVAPDGKVYFNDGTTASGETVNITNHILGEPLIKIISAQINKVILYGGYVDGTRLKSINEDTAAQQLYGVVEYIDHYPHILDQIELDDLAAKVRARDGMNNSPKYIDVELYGMGFEQCGTTLNFAFAPLSYSASNDILLSYEYNAKTDEGSYKLSTGLVQNTWRGYGSLDQKTKTGDEEQLDKIGTRLGSDFDMHYDVAGTANAQFSIIDIRIDASAQASTSMTHAINVTLADTLTGDVEALGVHGEIDPIHQHTISSWITPDQAGADAAALRVTSGPVYTAGIDGQTIFVADNDAIWLCDDSGLFDHLQVILSTTGSGPALITFEYYSTAGGGSWVTFSPIDETHGFTQNGIILWDSGDLANWDAAGDPAGGSGEEGYWIRITRTRNNLPTTPVVTTIKLAGTTEYKWDKTGDLTIGDTISTYGALKFKVSGDNDDYLQLYTSGGTPIIKVIDGSTVRFLSDSAANINVQVGEDGANRININWFITDGVARLISTDAIRIITNSETDDYLEFYTSGGVPRIKIIGGKVLYLESDHADDITLQLTRGSDVMSISLDATNNFGLIYSNLPIRMVSSGDGDDYFYFTTAANVAQILPVEDKVHNMGSAILSMDHVYSDDFDNTSPFEEFVDPLTDLKNIKPNIDKTKLDYTSLPDFVRTHTRDPSKHIWGKKDVIEEIYNEETEEMEEITKEVDYIIERAVKDVIESEGWSVNKMVMFLYQVNQKQQMLIEDLESRIEQLEL